MTRTNEVQGNAGRLVALALLVGLGGLAALGVATPAAAVTRTWTDGVGNGDFYNPNNWSPVGGPFESDDLTIGFGVVTGSSSPDINDGGSLIIEGGSTDVSFPGQGFLTVGRTTNGFLRLRGGATLHNDNVTILGDEAGTEGYMFVDGPGTFADLDDLYVGLRGHGLLEVTNGAEVTTRDTAWIMVNGSAGGSGWALVQGAGSELNIGVGGTKGLNLGANSRTGILRIEAGGIARASDVDYGVNGGRGEVVVTGPDSRFEVATLMEVGSYGAGSLDIADGGVVTAGSVGVHSLTFQNVGTSDVTVTGDGSRLDVATDLQLGQGLGISNSGPGSLTVDQRADVNVGGTLTVKPQGVLSVAELGEVTADTLALEGGIFTTGTNSNVNVNAVTGLGTNPFFGGSIAFGVNGGAADYTFDSGGTLFIVRGISVGRDDATAASHLTVANNSVIDAGFVTLGFRPGSHGVATVEPGSTLMNFDRMSLGIAGTAELRVRGATTSRSVYIGSEFGSIDPTEGLGALILEDGGTASFTDAFLTERGTLEIETGSKLTATTLDLAGDLIVRLDEAVTPAAGQTFDLLDFINLTGTFASMTLPDLSGSSLGWDTSMLLTTGALTLVTLGDVFGDFNASGLVEQGDLDLVLGNWGAAFDAIPVSWVNDRPLAGIIDQGELDTVLTNWGASAAPDFHSSSVPEPGTVGLLVLLLIRTASRRLHQAAHRE